MKHPLRSANWTCSALILPAGMLLASAFPSPAPAAETFIKIAGIEDARIRKVVLSKENPDWMAVASDNALYLSRDAGASFIKAAVLKDESINNCSLDGETGTPVYIAGTRNAYLVNGTLEKIFAGDEEEEVRFIRRHRDSLFMGTSKGLYYTDQSPINWQLSPRLRNEIIYSMESSGSDIYLTSASGAYLYRTDGSLDRLFIARGSGEYGGVTPNQIKVDSTVPTRLWLCTSKGVYISSNRGDTWKKFYIDGAGSAAAYCLVQFPTDENHFYLCSAAGFFKVHIPSGRSRTLLSGLPTSNVRWADISASGEIYLATDQGLFHQQQTAFAGRPQPAGLADILKGEPSIHEVQEAAMRYNSVHPEKTERWRKRLKFRALLPKVDLDYDKTIGSSFTSSGYYYAKGPYDWGVSLTWDMSDLVWNSYEDDVDNRTKLTTQLRLDILDEINRLYFERLRLKHEVMQAPPMTEETILKQLRLYELTATLDGYTGGLYTGQHNAAPRIM